MSQTSSREQQQQQQQERHSHSRTRTRSIGETETTTGANATKKKRTKSTTSTIASSSSRHSSPIPPSRVPSTLSLASSFLDPSVPHHEPVEHALVVNNNDAIEGISLLGSVWNLFRDVKDLASKEIDKLLEHFPYKNNTTRVIVTTSQVHKLSTLNYNGPYFTDSQAKANTHVCLIEIDRTIYRIGYSQQRSARECW